MPILYDDLNLVSNGGTELMLKGLEKRLDPSLLSGVSIARMIKTLQDNSSGKRILWEHEVAPTPETDEYEYKILRGDKWKYFDSMVFVSHWQKNDYINKMGFGWGDLPGLQVIHNAIEPIPRHQKPKDVVRLVYTSNPIRGLDILCYIFPELVKRYPTIQLEVFVDYNDECKGYEGVFDFINSHSNITHRGRVGNDELREALMESHILAYPCTYGETSCISLIEAMGAGLKCVHPDQCALPETSANLTFMYGYRDNRYEHAQVFLNNLIKAIETPIDNQFQIDYVNRCYSWDVILKQWSEFLSSL